MTVHSFDHARSLITETLSAGGFVDANAVASTIQRLYPTCGLPILIDAVVEETMMAGGSVAWDRAGMHTSMLGGENILRSRREMDVCEFVPSVPRVLQAS